MGTDNSNKNVALQAKHVGSVTWDAASILDGDEVAQDVTVTGAALGDFVIASHGVDVADLALTADVTAANTVTLVLHNSTGAGVDLASATARVLVIDKNAGKDNR